MSEKIDFLHQEIKACRTVTKLQKEKEKDKIVG